MVFLDIEINETVILPPNLLDPRGGLLLRKAIIERLLNDISRKKASEEHGYYVAVSTLNSIGDGEVNQLTGEVHFPVSFNCTTTKPYKGEILIGTIDKVRRQGIFLISGPIQNIFLSEKTMKDYKFSNIEEPIFVNTNGQTKMEKDSNVRFRIVGVKWIESDREFQVLATIAAFNILLKMVFLEVEMNENLVIPLDQLHSKGLLPHKVIILHLLEKIVGRKASKEHGYYIAITTLNSIGEDQVDKLTGETIFPVSFNCTTVKPCKGEILIGTINKVVMHGIFLKSGPIERILITSKTMVDYKFNMVEEPIFVNENQQSKIVKGTKVRFRVSGIRWIEWDKEFHIMAILAGDFHSHI
ncbi:hypothetical protein M5K25_021818 [Dendrobium thyrsiflorum]|uniref:DNA-directed RNA polymerase subunit n=1 Tax=Dendrobium thyrsiflorum TaxID=117978 RepID=A0ABD0UAU2_DENTH